MSFFSELKDRIFMTFEFMIQFTDMIICTHIGMVECESGKCLSILIKTIDISFNIHGFLRGFDLMETKRNVYPSGRGRGSDDINCNVTLKFTHIFD